MQNRPRQQPPKYVYNGRGREVAVNGVQTVSSSGLASPPPAVVAVPPTNPTELSSLLANASPQQQKQMLGERLFPLVQQFQVSYILFIVRLLFSLIFCS